MTWITRCSWPVRPRRSPAGVPGVCVRWCSYVLAGALILAGDLAGADDVCAAALARSRDAGDVFNQWSLLPAMVLLDVYAGRFEHAAAHLREGLQIAMRTGGWFELNHYLDGCGYLCAATGRPAEALTMWTASAALLGPADLRLRDLPVRAARQALGADRTRAAEDRGAAMSLAAAAEYALMLTAAPSAQQAPPALGKLSSRERELVTLVAQGRTNAQIAAELYISVRTVGSHLDRIRDKTGCRRRADLTRLALTTGLV